MGKENKEGTVNVIQSFTIDDPILRHHYRIIIKLMEMDSTKGLKEFHEFTNLLRDRLEVKGKLQVTEIVNEDGSVIIVRVLDEEPDGNVNIVRKNYDGDLILRDFVNSHKCEKETLDCFNCGQELRETCTRYQSLTPPISLGRCLPLEFDNNIIARTKGTIGGELRLSGRRLSLTFLVSRLAYDMSLEEISKEYRIDLAKLNLALSWYMDNLDCYDNLYDYAE